MYGFIPKLILTLTAMAPVGFILAWIEFKQGISLFLPLVFLGVSVSLVIMCSWMLYRAKTNEVINFKIDTIEAADRENLSFLLLYLIPLLTANLEKINWDIGIPLLLVFGITVLSGYSYHFNPLLNLLGWHFYKVLTPEGVTYVLLTKKELRKTSKKFKVVQLTEYIVLDVE